MRDTRTDPGQYYPGGSIVSRRGTTPPQVVVQWCDIRDKPQIEPLPERYRDADMKYKINEIASKFAALAMAVLVGFTAIADVTVHKQRKDALYNDDLVVVDVTGGGVDTNAVIDIIHATVDGSARPLPRYLHALDFCDSYPAEAAEYYRSRGDGKADGGCSAVREGGFLYRNFDFPLDERAEFVVRCVATAPSPSCPNGRFASVGVAQVGTNLTEGIVTSGKPSRCYKWLPGATVDGINENGVVAEVNVVDGDPHEAGWPTTGTIHCLGAVRWALDNATSALDAATNLAARIAFPTGWTQNFHWMIADERETWIVENGAASNVTGRVVMTNFPRLTMERGMGWERYAVLTNAANSITNAWFTRAYLRTTNWESDFGSAAEMEAAKAAWETHDREELRGRGLWQTVHCSAYDITNRTLRVAVQETDDWYVFAVPSAGGVKPEAVREIVRPMVADATNGLRRVEDMNVYEFYEENTSWTWTADYPPLAEILNRNHCRAVRRYPYPDQPDTFSWWIDGNLEGWEVVSEGFPPAPKDSLDVRINWVVGPNGEGGAAYAHRDSYRIPSEIARPFGDRLATTNGVNAAIAASGALTTNAYGIVTANVMLLGNAVTVGNMGGAVYIGDYGMGSDGLRVHIADGGYSSSVAIGGPRGESTVTIHGVDVVGALDGKQDALPYPTNAVPWSAITNAPTIPVVSATDTAFSNAVLAVGLNIDTNSVAVLNEIAATFGDFPIEGTATTVGGLLAALAAAVAWLRKRAAHLESDGMADDTFATDLLGKQVAINAMHYALNSGATIQDRAINLVTMTDTRQTITLPSRIAGKTRDLILRVEVGDLATIGGIALALGSTELASWEGDALDFAANKNYLVTVTETKNMAATDAQDAPTFFVRVVEMTAQPTAA